MSEAISVALGHSLSFFKTEANHHLCTNSLALDAFLHYVLSHISFLNASQISSPSSWTKNFIQSFGGSFWRSAAAAAWYPGISSSRTSNPILIYHCLACRDLSACFGWAQTVGHHAAGPGRSIHSFLLSRAILTKANRRRARSDWLNKSSGRASLSVEISNDQSNGRLRTYLVLAFAMP